MNVKGKTITNAATPAMYTDTTPDISGEIKKVPTIEWVNQACLTTDPADRSNFYANDFRLYELKDALIYKDSDVRTLPDPLEAGVFNVDPALLAKYASQGCNLKTVQNATVSLEDINRAYFIAQSKQIK